MAHIAIVGVGAIGGVLAASLQTTDRHDITLCTRRPLTTLVVKTPEEVISVHLKNITTPALAKPVDWVLIATKTYDAESAAGWLRTLCREDTAVAVVQNGVEHRERFEPYICAKSIVPVIIDCPSERQTNGSILQRGPIKMQVEDGTLGSSFASLFHGSKAKTEQTEDFLSVAWTKLCLNSIAALPAILMKSAGILQDDLLGQVAMKIVSECADVARAEGAIIDENIAARALERHRALPPDSVSSLVADRMARRRMEIESRNGVIVRKGRSHGIETPINQTIVALLNALT